MVDKENNLQFKTRAWILLDKETDQIEMARGGKAPRFFATRWEADEYRAEDQKVVKVDTSIEIWF